MVLGKLHKCHKIATPEEKVLIPHFFGKKKNKYTLHDYF